MPHAMSQVNGTQAQTNPEPTDEIYVFYQLFTTSAHVSTRVFYQLFTTVLFTTGIILSNFVIMATQAQINPEPTDEINVYFDRCEVAFTIVFCVELCLNM